MIGKQREPFRIIRGGLESNTSMAPTRAIGLPNESVNASMMGGGGRTEDGWLGKVCNRLAEIETLQPGWDGYGANRFPNTILTFTAQVLAIVYWSEASDLPIPNITPMSNGAIMVEWRSPTHELTLEVNAPNDVDVSFEEIKSGNVSEFHVTSNFSQISDALEQSARRVHAVA
jgi:hypothetical protein